MEIKTIQDAKKLLWQYSEKIIWIESSAFLIYFPWIFLSNFEIIAYKNSLDTATLKKSFKIRTLDTLVPWKVSRIGILENTDIQKYIEKQKTSYIITRKETPRTEKLIKTLNLRLLWNKSKIRNQYENKKIFREILTNIWITPISWENIDIETFLKKGYTYRKSLYWKKIVLQIPEITKGGGSWTIFINNEKELNDFKEIIKDKVFKNKIIASINITKYIWWESISIIGCTTKRWTLTNCVQTQIIDIPEVINTTKWSWLFCWHDRSFKHYSKKIQEKADKITQKIGNDMYQKWYKGIFWLDLITNKNEIYVVECNSRYTWAMPMLSMLDIKNNTIPMDAFHILEHLNIPYTINFDAINKTYKKKKEGSHIILSNREEHNITCKKQIKSWIYICKEWELIFQREWYDYNKIQNNNEFIITDGNPRKWQIIKWYKESCRICRIMFPKNILINKWLIDKTKVKIINIIYNKLFW